MRADLVVTSTQAATMFTEDFSSNTLGPNLSITQGVSGNLNTTGGDAKFTATSDANRVAIGTNDSDYATVDFIATIDVTDRNNAFFGMGPGSSSKPNFYGEPADGPVVYMRTNDTAKGDVFLYFGGETSIANSFQVLTPGVTGITNVRMINTAATDMLEFLYSTDGGANYNSVGSVDYSGSTLGSGVSKIFASGGNGPASIDNFTVAAVPEPAASLLGILGLATLLRRRRA